MKRFFWLIVFPLLAACQVNHKNDAYMENRFFKILTPAQCQNFQSERVFLGSELDQQDGFIHLSLQSQWNRIWQKFFNADECYLLEIDGYSLNPEALKKINDTLEEIADNTTPETGEYISDLQYLKNIAVALRGVGL